MLSSSRLYLALSCVALAISGGARAQSLAPGARYVSMGSSFAAGPGVTESADTPPNACGRSVDNYAHQLARKRKLLLVDMGCNGATTRNVLEGQNGLPPQVDALTPDTKLVTITIGGNDVSYMGAMIGSSCRNLAGADAAAAQKCNVSFVASEAQWRGAEQGMDHIVAEVRRRSPSARLVFVDYLTAFPARGLCAGLPLSPADAERLRAVAGRLAEMTARVAHRNKVELIRASSLSRSHNVCSPVPWSVGYVPLPRGTFGPVPYHPNLAGMTAIAGALDRLLGR